MELKTPLHDIMGLQEIDGWNGVWTPNTTGGPITDRDEIEDIVDHTVEVIDGKGLNHPGASEVIKVHREGRDAYYYVFSITRLPR